MERRGAVRVIWTAAAALLVGLPATVELGAPPDRAQVATEGASASQTDGLPVDAGSSTVLAPDGTPDLPVIPGVPPEVVRALIVPLAAVAPVLAQHLADEPFPGIPSDLTDDGRPPVFGGTPTDGSSATTGPSRAPEGTVAGPASTVSPPTTAGPIATSATTLPRVTTTTSPRSTTTTTILVCRAQALRGAI